MVISTSWVYDLEEVGSNLSVIQGPMHLDLLFRTAITAAPYPVPIKNPSQLYLKATHDEARCRQFKLRIKVFLPLFRIS